METVHPRSLDGSGYIPMIFIIAFMSVLRNIPMPGRLSFKRVVHVLLVKANGSAQTVHQHPCIRSMHSVNT